MITVSVIPHTPQARTALKQTRWRCPTWYWEEPPFRAALLVLKTVWSSDRKSKRHP